MFVVYAVKNLLLFCKGDTRRWFPIYNGGKFHSFWFGGNVSWGYKCISNGKTIYHKNYPAQTGKTVWYRHVFTWL